MAKSEKDPLEKNEKVQRTTLAGRPPKKRIVNAKAALAIVNRMKQEGEEAAYSRASIQGLYDGNPPFSRAEMKRRGYGWMANTDWGEFRNSINLAAASIWNMLVNVQTLVSLQTDIYDPQNPDNDYGMKIAVRFTQMLKKWKPFRYDIMRKILDMLKFGVSGSYWIDDVDWRSRPIRTSNLLVHGKAECRPGELKIFGLRDELSIEEIFDMIEGEEIDDGWNLDYTRKKILKVVQNAQSTGNDRYMLSDWESLQQAVKNKDDAWNREFDGLRVIHLFSEEIGDDEEYEDRKITHQIILENDDEGEEKVQFMYEKIRRFKDIDTVLNLMLYNLSDGWIKSVKGLGREIFHPAHASNRMLNSMLDGVVMGSGLLVQMLDANAAEKFNIVRKGPVTIVPEDAKLQQQQVAPTITPTVQARSVIQNVSNRNVGATRGRGENLYNAPPTAEQVRSEDINEADIESNQAEWYYLSWEAWLQETFRRVLNPDYSSFDGGYEEHKWLMDKLRSDGIPEELLDADKWECTATRSIGLGSIRSAMNITNAMVSMKPALDEQGRRNVDRQWFAVRVGWENVDQFVSTIDRDAIPTLAHAMAEGENIDMMDGHTRTVPVDDPHAIHLGIHLRGALQVVKVFLEGNSTDMEGDTIGVAIIIRHIAGHLSMLAQDELREQQVKMFEAEVKKLVEAHQQMGNAAEALKKRQMEEAERQRKTVEEAQKVVASRELEAKMYEAEKKAEVEMYEARLLHEARMTKTHTSIMAQVEKLQADIVALNAKVAAEISREDARVISQIEREEGG